MRIRLLILIVCAKLLTSCSTVLSQVLLDVKWVHSMEEDTDSTIIYRRDGYDFPPSRGRDALRLKADGSLEIFSIGRTDKPEVSMGKWKKVGEGKFELSFSYKVNKVIIQARVRKDGALETREVY